MAPALSSTGATRDVEGLGEGETAGAEFDLHDRERGCFRDIRREARWRGESEGDGLLGRYSLRIPANKEPPKWKFEIKEKESFNSDPPTE
jgi:hypothetical protein